MQWAENDFDLPPGVVRLGLSAPVNGKNDTDKMYQWAEDDGDLPLGVGRLDLSEPVSGRRYVMYHGTTSQAARSIMATGFQQSGGGMLGPGVYLSRDLEKASRYPIKHPEHNRVVIKVVVNVGRVIAINYQGHPRQKTWHDYRYGEVFDTAWVPPRCGMVSSGFGGGLCLGSQSNPDH
uniref:PARP catalytic domain-containing protein n=1 Tax=Labrus bergylta TaxID=56723 RepID=A0A3Q3EPR9_9LABR